MDGFDYKRILIGITYAGLGYLDIKYDISILTKELWMIFNIFSVIYLSYSYKNDWWGKELGWIPLLIIFLIGYTIIGPILFDLEYFEYAKIYILIGMGILFTSMG